ncbi:MAG: ABC transporter ATP-binding protein [Rickettsiales bacterium]|nr:ABC transporter ATP-binding protein [Rickettsiales bacterium]
MSSNAIVVNNLSKSYRLYDSPRQRLWSLLRPGGVGIGKRFDALKPLSFEIEEGQTIGIIGRNGSGKSTLLQCLAGTLTPTTGEASTDGTVAALLELGAGFNPDFTGRENVYLNGAILGFSRELMAERIDSILEFANIGEFIDRPLSTYSSGMVVRLAFAVATAVQPKVLIVDEALSVGDEAFQRKCFRRIEQMRESGTSILFVSHSTQAIVQLCDRVIWLDRGDVIMDGEPKAITEEYHRYLNAPADQRAALLEQIIAGEGAALTVTTESKTGHEYVPNGGRIEALQILTKKGEPITTLSQGADYKIRYQIHFEADVEDICCGMMLKNRTGVEVAAATLSLGEHKVERAKAGESVQIEYNFTCHLCPGMFFLNVGVMGSVDGDERYLHRKVDAMELQVLTPRKVKGITLGGLTDLNFSSKVEVL